ncbi:hypothetical protein ACS0TY_036086 [Phlomoides rotata]
MSTNWVPESIVIKPMSRSSGGYGYFGNQNFVRCNENSIFSELARLDIERSKEDHRFIHIRFRHTNKYWSRRGPGENNHWIVAVSNKPEEDTTKETCTLFEPSVVSDGRFRLRHVQSGGHVMLDGAETGNLSHRLFVFAGSLGEVSFDRLLFDFVNWQTLFKMPSRVSLKGSNDRWLRTATIQSQAHLQFSSEDPNDRESAFEIELNDDGHIRIRSFHLGRYLRRNTANNWLVADALETNKNDDTMFWPVLVTGSRYALRSKGSNFCRLQTEGTRINCLNASASTMSIPATFTFQELILERHVYHTRFRMDQLRIHDERTFIAGTGTSVNNSDSPSALTITISYEEKTAYSFTNGTSTTEGVTTTISTRIPRIMELEVGLSNSTTKSFEWGEDVEESRLAEASVEVTVPPRSGVRVDYVGTQGTCSIPFNYTQRDKSSTDGQYVTSSNIDGIFKGVNYYSFHFEQHAVERLTIPPDAVAP